MVAQIYTGDYWVIGPRDPSSPTIVRPNYLEPSETSADSKGDDVEQSMLVIFSFIVVFLGVNSKNGPLHLLN